MAKEQTKAGRIAVVRVRGVIGPYFDIRRTLELLKLHRKNCCTVLPNSPNMVGMLKVAKDYVTWGEIDDETYKLLVERRGQKDPKDPKKVLNTFNLAPPRKGYGRKGIKQPFAASGALGYRGEKMNDLVKRML
jgi:large subunit ribosomal protein L30